MSLYVASDSPDLMLLDYIIVKGIQSYVVSTGNADSSFEITVRESEKLNISESVTVANALDNSISEVDSIEVSESTTVTVI